MKALRLEIKIYREMKTKDYTLSALIYKVIKSLTIQHKQEWISLEDVIYIVESIIGKRFTEETLSDFTEALTKVKDCEYIECKEFMVGRFTKTIMVKVIK